MPDSTPLQQFTIEEPAPGYWRVLFSNPPINLLNSTTVLEIAEITRRIEAASDLRVVVFASENPDFFMARYDLQDTNPVAFAPTESGVTLFIDSTLRLAAAGPITIAQIRGRARGGGSEFALGCDMRFASLENAVLGQPEVGVGIVPAGGGLERLAALVGIPRALEIVAGSDDYDAATAERYGWINRAIPDAELDGFVDGFARRLATFDASLLATTKRLANRPTPASMDHYRETLGVLRNLFASPATAARRAVVVKQAVAAGPDFERRMGYHLGAAGTAP
ncbi:MAG: enoyl-CoA hydratase [Bradyrhizobium sp.]|nr:enoyl-CoA hydratase [Bradyrhizobium sp.]